MTNQLHYILFLLVAGAAMGVVFDVYNTVTGASKWIRWIRPILDLSFWILGAVAVFYITDVTDNGRFRIYTFVLAAIGYLVYRVTLHRQVVQSAFVFVRAVAVLVRALTWCLNVFVFKPLLFLLDIVKHLAMRIYSLLCIVEDGLFWLIRFWMKVIGLPLRKPWQRTEQIRGRILARWEGIWERASKWLTNKSDPVS